jgi:hypothetical protein
LRAILIFAEGACLFGQWRAAFAPLVVAGGDVARSGFLRKSNNGKSAQAVED